MYSKPNMKRTFNSDSDLNFDPFGRSALVRVCS